MTVSSNNTYRVSNVLFTNTNALNLALQTMVALGITNAQVVATNRANPQSIRSAISTLSNAGIRRLTIQTRPVSPQPVPKALAKAKSILLPEFSLNGELLGEALKRIYEASTRYDPDRRGINFVIDQEVDAATRNRGITLSFKATSVAEAVEGIATSCNLEVMALDQVVLLRPRRERATGSVLIIP